MEPGRDALLDKIAIKKAKALKPAPSQVKNA